METFSALLAICAGNPPVTREFPTQRPVTRSFDVFFHLRLNKQLSKQSWSWWFETLSRPFWRHCNYQWDPRAYVRIKFESVSKGICPKIYGKFCHHILPKPQFFNSSRLSDAYMSVNYTNIDSDNGLLPAYAGLLLIRLLGTNLLWNFNQHSTSFVRENEGFEIIAYKMMAIFSRSQLVKCVLSWYIIAKQILFTTKHNNIIFLSGRWIGLLLKPRGQAIKMHMFFYFFVYSFFISYVIIFYSFWCICT